MGNIGVAATKDVVVTTPDEFAWRKDVVGTIEWPAEREGKILYAVSLPYPEITSRFHHCQASLLFHPRWG